MGDLLTFAALDDSRCGTPETLRWLLIRPNGTVSVRESDNRIIFVAEHRLWFQWALERDVHRDVDPGTRGPWRPIVWSVSIPTGGHGVVVAARLDHDRPDNPLATAMLESVGVDYRVRGDAAWLGERDADDGLHGDLNGPLLAALCAFAARWRR